MDEEYNKWYNEVHVPDLLEIPGVKSCARYRGRPLGGRPAQFDYLAVYEIDGDFDAVFKEIQARSADGRHRISPALDPAATKVTAWQPV
ncbi:hypothetical protein OHB12_05720 [Nocardia sp. NBC_01730]|uniref:hypothetical protein n=1 Tax=Nocardia sp. NBC_01730 TaxID=2975998 RepID=UPI002E124149|nr:hypothetical protein OHB12_05720 [Nocardia sp. NBC_01730]